MPPRAVPGPGAAAGRELHDHAGAVLLKPFLQPREALGVRGGLALVVADMAVGDGRSGLERFLGAFDLLGDGDRHRRVVAPWSAAIR